MEHVPPFNAELTRFIRHYLCSLYTSSDVSTAARNPVLLVTYYRRPHLLSGTHGSFLQSVGRLELALPPVEGAEVLQGGGHRGAGKQGGGISHLINHAGEGGRNGGYI